MPIEGIIALWVHPFTELKGLEREPGREPGRCVGKVTYTQTFLMLGKVYSLALTILLMSWKGMLRHILLNMSYFAQ